MENKIERIYKARERRYRRNQIGIVLFGMPFRGVGIICGILGLPWFFIHWCYEKVKKFFQPKEFSKEKFRKWFEKPHNFKHFLCFWDEKNFSIEVNPYSNSFAGNLKKWKNFSFEIRRYLIHEYEIEGYEKEWNEYEPDNIEFYKKDSQQVILLLFIIGRP